MLEIYFKDNRKHYRTYCDSCNALLDDTSPLSIHISRDVLSKNICPYCNNKIFKDASNSTQPN